jgi:hypothetical protein
MERLDAGHCETVNPFFRNQVRRVSLLPADDVLFVFWTRDPRNILASADELANRGYRYYVLITVTGYPLELEPSMVRTSKALTAIKALAQKIGPDRVIWRYDPVLLTSITDEAFHRENFNSLAKQLEGSVRRVIISIYDEYKEAKKRLGALEKMGILQMLDTSTILPQLLPDLAKTAEAAGMEIQSCAEKEDFSPYGIKGGACIDAALINKLFGIDFSGKDKNQRPHCLCCKSVDIGAYRLCGAYCVYCYAW